MNIGYDKLLGRLREYGTEGNSSGDMLKSVYDVDDNAIVDNAEQALSVGGKSAAEVAAAVEAMALIPVAGQDGGYAPLAGGKIPVQYLNSNASTHVVADIAARNNLNPTQEGERALVRDATADPTVTSGAAEYVWDGAIWFKIAETESLDLILDWGSLINKPATFPPSDHNHAIANVTGLQTELNALTPLRAQIKPDDPSTYEVVPVGTTRSCKTLTEAYVYMQTKNMGSKGFSLILDPGNYEGISFSRCSMQLYSADSSNRAIITGTLSFATCPYVYLTRVKVAGSVQASFDCHAHINDIEVVSSTTRGIVAQIGSTVRLEQSTVIQENPSGDTSLGILVTEGSYMRISDTQIQGGWSNGIRVDQSQVKLLSGVTITGCTMAGLFAQNGSFILATGATVTFSDNAADTLPAANTTGNYNSYIRR